MTFIGGPFNPGHHQAILTYLRAHVPDFPQSITPTIDLSDEDFDRAMPRHFSLDEPMSTATQAQIKPQPSL